MNDGRQALADRHRRRRHRRLDGGRRARPAAGAGRLRHHADRVATRSARSASAKRRCRTSRRSTTCSASTRPSSCATPRRPSSSGSSSSAGTGRASATSTPSARSASPGRASISSITGCARCWRARRRPLAGLFAIAVAAAAATRFEFPDEDRKSIRSTYAYAYHFDAGLYANFLRDWATARGVDADRGPDRRSRPRSRERPCRGADADNRARRRRRSVHRLLGLPLAAARPDDGSALAGLERMAAVRPRARGAMRADRAALPYTRATAQHGRLDVAHPAPASHRQRLCLFQRIHAARRRRARPCSARSTAQRSAEPRLLRFQAGRRAQAPGQAMSSRIGLAGGFLEPLESTSIFLIQAAVTDLPT